MSVSEIREFIFETVINKLDFLKKHLLFRETSNKSLQLLANKRIENILTEKKCKNNKKSACF